MKRIVGQSGTAALRTRGLPVSGGVETEQFVFALGVSLETARCVSVMTETRHCIHMIRDTLAEAGCTLDDVVKVTVYLDHLTSTDAMNEAYRDAWEPPEYPLRFVIYCALAPGVRVMMDATAVKEAASKCGR